MSAADAGGGQLHLEVVSGNAAGFSLAVDERLMIGRQSEGPGRLADDPELSRHHAKISRRPDGTFVIEDLASTNGTQVNGERIEAPAVLATRDSIEVGGTTISVAAAPAEPAEPAVPATVDPRSATVTVETPPELREAAPEPPPPATPPEPEPPTVEASPRMPRLTLRLVVDPEQGEAELQLGDEAEPVRLSLRDGRWQASDGES